MSDVIQFTLTVLTLYGHFCIHLSLPEVGLYRVQKGKCWENRRAQKVPTAPTLAQGRNAHSITLGSV